MKKLALVGGGLILSVFLVSCETVKGLGRDLMNLGDVMTGKKPTHTTPLRQQGLGTQDKALDSDAQGALRSDQLLQDTGR